MTKQTKKVKKQNKKSNKIFGRAISVIIIVAIISILFSIYSSPKQNKYFEYEGKEWIVITYDNVDAYYPKEYLEEDTPDLFLTNDPRLNPIKSSGEFTRFSKNGYLSLSPEVEECAWEMPRAIDELEEFLKYETKLNNIKRTTTDAATAIAKNDTSLYQNCYTSVKKSTIIIELGNPSITQTEENDYCYKIKIEDCHDVEPIEKFITEILTEDN